MNFAISTARHTVAQLVTPESATKAIFVNRRMLSEFGTFSNFSDLLVDFFDGSSVDF